VSLIINQSSNLVLEIFSKMQILFLLVRMESEPSTGEEDEHLIEGLEEPGNSGGHMLHHHLSQSSFEAKTIAEATAFKPSTAPYPLDGRNLELSGHAKLLMKKKRKRLQEGIETKKDQERLLQQRKINSSSSSNVNAQVNEEFVCLRHLWEKLYDFQKTGVKFLLSKYSQNTGGLLADEMGLGKSVQVVAFLASLASTFEQVSDPALLICPSTLVAHWEDEFHKWNIPSDLINVNRLGEDELGSRRHSSNHCSLELYITSYELFRSRATNGLFPKNTWSVVILDEAQRIRNPDAKTTLSVKQLNCYCRIALSGSPIQNNLSELWSIFDFVAPGRLGTLPTFQEELAVPIETGTKPKASLSDIQLSYRCAVLVRDLTAPLMLRRLKADFASELELADKEEQVLFCQLTSDQIELYCKFLSTQTVREAQRRDSKTMLGKTFYAISVLRKICNHPDLLLADERDVDDFGDPSRSGKLGVLIPLLKLWHSQGKRCLVFSQSLGMLDILGRVLSGLGMSFSRMDGSTPMSSRALIVDSFDQSKHSGSRKEERVFCLLLSTRVGGVGLNLTGAERVVIFDPDWNPMTDAQARERSWRIGQKKHVKIYRLISADSVEESICKRQIFKHHLAQKILVDPRQSKVTDWDSMFDLFKPPQRGSVVVSSKTTQKILGLIDRGDIPADNDQEEEGGTVIEGGDVLESLITKVWNQDTIELPKIASVLVDEDQTEAAASRAIQAVLSESSLMVENRDITVPTWTGKSGGETFVGPKAAKERSKSLISRLTNSEAPVSKRILYESEQLVVEKAVVRDLVQFFRKRPQFAAQTSEVLNAFSSKITAGQSEIFRSCLRQLCDFVNGELWVLKPDHR
jgi:SNF2 family DNA or RNA helicase